MFYCRCANDLLYRRIICARVGKSRLVTNESEVNEAAGVYISRPLSEMKEFLNDPVFALCRHQAAGYLQILYAVKSRPALYLHRAPSFFGPTAVLAT